MVGGFGDGGGDLDGAVVVVDGDEGEIGGEDVFDLEGAEILGDDADANFHGGAPSAVDRGHADEDVSLAGGIEETDGVDGEGNADDAGMPFCDNGGERVGDLKGSSAKEGPMGIEVVGKDLKDLVVY